MAYASYAKTLTKGIAYYAVQRTLETLEKGVLKLYSKFTGELPCRSEISVKLQSNFIEIAPWHRCYPVNLLHIFRTPFPKNTSGRLLLKDPLT